MSIFLPSEGAHFTETLEPPETGVAVQPAARWPASDQDWDQHRQRIKQLYLDEGQPLKRVMMIMERDYLFKASVKMYKNKITKWRLDKKNKKHEMQAILRKQTQRSAVGKASRFELRGRPVNMQDVQRYLERNDIAVENVMSPSAANALTPIELHCFTPSPVPASPKTPRELELPEQLLSYTPPYFLSSFETSIWVSNGDSQEVLSTRDIQGTGRRALTNLQNSMESTAILLDQGNGDAASILFRGYSEIQEFVTMQTLNLMQAMVETGRLLPRNGFLGIASDVLDRIAEMLVGSQSFHQMFALLHQLGPTTFEEFVDRALLVLRDHRVRFLGWLHLSTIEDEALRRIELARRSHTGDQTSRENRLQNLPKECELRFGPHDARSCILLLRLVDLFILFGKLDRAELTGQDRFTDVSPSYRQLMDLSETIRCMSGLEQCLRAAESVPLSRLIGMRS